MRARLLLFLGLLPAAARALPPGAPLAPADLQFFESKVRPVLAGKCYSCHSERADRVRGGLLLDTREAVLAGGNSGPAVVPGKPDESLLVQAIRYADPDLQMPPKGEKLAEDEIAALSEWVRRGAPDPRTKGAAPAGSYAGKGRNHWAFQPVRKPEPPPVRDESWVHGPIDRFVLASLEANGMKPNPPAERAHLIRRLYFDLVGLPPHPAEVQKFVADTAPDAVERLVDRLLATPQYGEHWARYWLDVARYADTKGDAPRQDDNRFPHAWTYRDWVINAFNADLPYNQFIIAQLAGDRLQTAIDQRAKAQGQPPPAQRAMLPALGFLTLGNQFNGRKDDIIGDQIDVTTKAFLGLTVTCARCHDHKFDPVSLKDYYSLYGVFANTAVPAVLPPIASSVPRTEDYLDYLEKTAALDQRTAELREQQAELRRAAGGKAKGKAAAAKIDPGLRQRLQRMERELHRDVADLETKHPGAPARAHVLEDVPRPRDYPVLLRGEAQNKGEIVPRRFLEILSPDPKKRAEWKQGSGRWQLALAIADPKNPLTARVIVNRLWQQHWGQGFVPTPDDLGNMSAPPTHPELLDWLAATFVEEGWSLKALHRKIVLSNAYQQSTATHAEHAAKDPHNRLLWRYNLRRMDFEELHDSLLAIAGELDRTYGGKPVAISSEGFAKRRAVYTIIDRTNPPELLTQFDFPSPDVATGRRHETLVPQQALFLMNSPMVIETARKLVDRPAFAQLKSDEERVTLLYLAIFQRWPTRAEVDLGLKYVAANPAGPQVSLTADQPAAKLTARDAKARKAATKASPKQQGRFNTQVGGVYENRPPLDAWAKLAHALFQTNEAMFYN